MAYEDGLAKLESRAKLAKAALWLFAAVAAAEAVGEMLEAMGAVDIAVDDGPLALAIGLAYVGFTLAFFGSVVVVAMWIHRGHANLHEAGVDGLEFTPGWAVGWYFIPFANLVKPFQAMRELWAASHAEDDRFGGETASEVKWWWGAWISGNILSGIGTRILLIGEGAPETTAIGNTLGAVSTALIILAAVLLARLIGAITAAQRSGGIAATVFA